MAERIVDRSLRLYVKAEDDILLAADLSDGAFRTFLVLRRHAISGGSAFPTIDRLVRLRGCSKATVNRHIRELRALGLIEREQEGRGRAATTYLNDPADQALKIHPWEKPASVTGDSDESQAVSPVTQLAVSPVTRLIGKERKGKEDPAEEAESDSPVSPKRKRKAKKKRRSKKATTAGPAKPYAEMTSDELAAAGKSDQTVFIRWLVEEYMPSIGRPIVFDGGRDARTVARLLKAHGLDRLKRLVEMSTEDEWLMDERGWSVLDFFRQSNKYSTRLAAREGAPKRKKKTKMKKRYHFTETCGRHAPDEECEECLAEWRAYRKANPTTRKTR